MAPNLCDLLSESKQITKAHRRHFLILSLIFLLPFSVCSLIYPTLSHLFNPNNSDTSFLFLLLYSLFLLLFSICAVISISYSIFHFFYGQPVDLLSSIKCISSSFLPLLATTTVSQVIFFFISVLYGLLLALIFTGAELVNLTIPYSSPYLIAFFAALPLLLVILYLQVNWTLVPVLVVVESCWGLEPLRRSARLMKGMKGVAMSSLFFFGFFLGVLEWSCLFLTTRSYGSDESWVLVVRDWIIILGYSCLISMLMQLNIAVNTVLYIYCKANPGEVEDKFGKDYASLPINDGKVSYVV